MDFKGKKVLITGGLGFIGSNLAVRLCKHNGADVTLLTRSTARVNNVTEILREVRVVQGEITDVELVGREVSRADFVFHLAAQTSNIVSMERPLLDLETNAKGTLTVLEASRRRNPKAEVVGVGSTTQYGKPERVPIDENHPSRPITIYDVNKLACENYFKVYHSAFGLRTVFLRLPTVYGERQNLSGTRTGIVNSFIGRALRGEKIKVFGRGDFLRDFIYVGDIVDALIASTAKPAVFGEHYQVTTGKGTLFAEMVKVVVETVKELSGRDGKYEFVPWPKDWAQVDVGDFVGDYTRFNKATGWKPRVSLREGVERTVRYYLKAEHEKATTNMRQRKGSQS